MKIEVLGSGCPKCKQLEANAKEAVQSEVKAEIVKITDIDEIIEKGVMMTPALIIDGKIKSTGRIPSVEEIKEWIKNNKNH